MLKSFSVVVQEVILYIVYAIIGCTMNKIELTAPLGFLILHELRSPQTGTDLAKRIGERKGTALLTPGTIYPALKELREKKLVIYVEDGRKKVYSLTPSGKKELNGLYGEFSRLFRGLRHKIRSMR